MPALFSALAGWLLQFLGSAFIVAMGYMFSDVLLGLVAQFIDLGVAAVNAAGADFPSLSVSLSALPVEMREIMVRISLPEAFAIILSAVSVRFASSLFSTLRGLNP
jgi:hypothetical protein